MSIYELLIKSNISFSEIARSMPMPVTTFTNKASDNRPEYRFTNKELKRILAVLSEKKVIIDEVLKGILDLIEE